MFGGTATSSNYYDVARQDDTAVESGRDTPSTPVSDALGNVAYVDLGLGSLGENLESSSDDKASIRQRRIAAAIQRSKQEYKPEHAYTERGWFLDKFGESSVSGGQTKVDRQRLEYQTGALYLSDDGSPSNSSIKSRAACCEARKPASEALRLILETYDSTRPLGNLSKELLDIGIRAAIACGDRDNAVKLARIGKSAWRSNSVGSAVIASDAFAFARMPYEALQPLLWSLSTSGLHFPILNRLTEVLDILLDTMKPQSQSSHGDSVSGADLRIIVKVFRDLVEVISASKQPSFTRTLFDDEAPETQTSPIESLTSSSQSSASALHLFKWPEIDQTSLRNALQIDEEGAKALIGALNRMVRAIAASQGGIEIDEEKDEKGVREL